MRRLAAQNNEHDGIDHLLAQMMNKFCVEWDFSAQETSHQLISIPMIECWRIFKRINLIQEFSVTQVIDVRIRAGRSVSWNENDYSKLELYMCHPLEMLELSYYQTVKGYIYNKRMKIFVPRREEAIILIHPYKWNKDSIFSSKCDLTLLALKWNDDMRNAGHENPEFITAARRVLLLYLSFTDFDRLIDLGQIARGPHEDIERYDLIRNNDRL